MGVSVKQINVTSLQKVIPEPPFRLDIGVVVWYYTIPSPKLTVRPCKWMVGILVSSWKGLFSGAMLVSGSVILS